MRHLQIYAYIQAVVAHGSIRKASEYLTISPSALNRQILAFEAELGVPIFERLGVGVRLSTAGEMYYRTIIGHLAAMEGTQESIRALEGLQIGTVGIAVSGELVRYAARQVARFREDYPGVQVTLREVAHDGFTAALTARQADLALVAQPVYRAGAETLASAECPLVAVTPEAGGRVSLDMIEDHDLVLPTPASALHELIELWFARQALPMRAALRTDRLLAPQRLPRRSLQFWPELDLDAAEAAMARPLARPIRSRIALCREEKRSLPPAAERMAGWLAEALTRV